ncbi:MAG: hypothetical protein R3F11_30030 [Verrucomicrobiales bacterium]
MKNPYHQEDPDPHVAMGARSAWLVIALFLAFIALPPLYRNVFEALRPAADGERWVPAVEVFNFDPQGEKTLAKHFQEFEKPLDDAPFTEPVRRAVQRAEVAALREGNRKVVVGNDGWLFYRPGLDALAGYGPVRPEPDTVAKDPNRAPWRGPAPAIRNFARQLREFGCELILVPIPIKPMIYPEKLTGSAFDRPLKHPDADALYRELEASGVRVIDLTEILWSAKQASPEPLFLKTDTHWTPEGMAFFAATLAEALRHRPWMADLPADRRFQKTEVPREGLGDLVGMLGLEGTRAFEAEHIAVREVFAQPGGEPFAPDPAAPVVLLGDSFVNIYADESLGWGAGAGFAAHLAMQLGMPLDVIARNGQAATGVRRELASRPEAAAMMRQKKAVVWALAARDLFLSETPAQETGVVWEDVKFRESGAAESPVAGDGPVEVTGEVIKRYEPHDPNRVTYQEEIFPLEYRITEGAGSIKPGDTVIVYHWAFREKKLLPASRYQVGDSQRLTLVRLSEKAELSTIQRIEFDIDFDAPEPIPYWAEAVSAPGADPSPESEPTGSLAFAHAAAAGSCLALAALAFLAVKALRNRRYGMWEDEAEA